MPVRVHLLLALAMPLSMSVGAPPRESPAAQLPCKSYLVPWNCAGLFSGSFEWQSSLTGGAGQSQISIQENVTVVIKAGAAMCLGTRKGTIRTPDTETQLILGIQGPGLVAVEFGTNTEDDPKGPYYLIKVACPTPSGEEVNIDRRTGAREVLKVAATTPRGFDGEDQQSDKQRGSEKDKILQGSKTDDHPESDPANGVSGKITTTWKLTRP